jgi:hypothetical protein
MEITFARKFETLKIRGIFKNTHFITVIPRFIAVAAWIQPQIRLCVCVVDRVALRQELS